MPFSPHARMRFNVVFGIFLLILPLAVVAYTKWASKPSARRIFEAIATNDMTYFVEHAADFVAEADAAGYTAIHHAAKYDRAEMLKSLFRSCWNQLTKSNESILHLCVKHNAQRSLDYVLKQMSQKVQYRQLLGLKDKNGNTALLLCPSRDGQQAARLYMESDVARRFELQATNSEGQTVGMKIAEFNAINFATVLREFVELQVFMTQGQVLANVDEIVEMLAVKDVHGRSWRSYLQAAGSSEVEDALAEIERRK